MSRKQPNPPPPEGMARPPAPPSPPPPRRIREDRKPDGPMPKPHPRPYIIEVGQKVQWGFYVWVFGMIVLAYALGMFVATLAHAAPLPTPCSVDSTVFQPLKIATFRVDTLVERCIVRPYYVEIDFDKCKQWDDSTYAFYSPPTYQYIPFQLRDMVCDTVFDTTFWYYWPEATKESEFKLTR